MIMFLEEVDLAIVKATSHVEVLPKEKHIRTIIDVVSASRPRADVAYCVHALARRLAKARNWAVALKTLIVVHRAMREVDPTFREELINYSRSRGLILNVSHFRDDSSTNERQECLHILKYDVQTDHSRTKDLDTVELLEQLPALQQLLFRLLACQPKGAARNNLLIQYALTIVATESIKLYVAITDGTLNLIDKFFEMQRRDAVRALEIYKKAGNQAESLSELLEICRGLGFGHGQKYIKIEQPPASFMTAMEDYVKDDPQILMLPWRPVETVAQFGVVFLLFALGLEFSLSKLCRAKLSEGVFVGCFLSMSSTAVVVKYLVERNSNNALHGQVTIGILIFQDCAVGILFALLPVMGGNSGILQGMISMGKLLLVLSIYLLVASILTWLFIPRFLKLMIQLSSQTNELYQLASVAFCLLSAWCSDKLGLSLELGSFVAGVMISTTDFAQHTLDQVEPIRNLFTALFLSSIGMLIHIQFLWIHVDILLASVILVVVVKTTVVAMVTKAFGYITRTSFMIGEFAFVLLSHASNLRLIEGKMYLLLLGTTALSLVTTPVLFKLIPAMMHLGALMHWFPAESSTQNEEKVSLIEVNKLLL